MLAVAGLQLQIGIHAGSFTRRDGLEIAAHLVEGEAWIGIQRESGQHALHVVVAVAHDRELVVDRLVARLLELLAEVKIDEGGLTRGERAHDRDHRPPGNPRGEGRGVVQQAEAISYAIEHPEALHDLQQKGVLLRQVRT